MELLKLVAGQAAIGVLIGLGLRGFLGSVTHNDGFVRWAVFGGIALPFVLNLEKISSLLF